MQSNSPPLLELSYHEDTNELTILVNSELPLRGTLLSEFPKFSEFADIVETLPQILKRQYPDGQINILFFGGRKNYSQFVKACGDIILNATLKYSGKPKYKIYEASDEHGGIVRRPLASAAPRPQKELEVCVAAITSSGKSTLINALLGRQLMPSMQQACTAIIARIRDDDTYAGKSFAANVIGKDGNVIKKIRVLTAKKMRELNCDPNVMKVEIVGDIKCVPSDEIALALVDTPGPNNARDKNHRRVQRGQLSTGTNALVLYVLTPEFGSDDEYTLLQDVAEIIAQEGSQNRGRFLFVLNKVDLRRKEDGPLEKTLHDLRAYLRSHGMENPRIFPVSAYPALLFRRMLNPKDKLADEDMEEAERFMRKFNRKEDLHLEKYAREFSGLPEEVCGRLTREAATFANAHGRDGLQNFQAALAHTGIPALEAAFLEYILKYGKNLADSAAR